jgi:mono/diheme cytochrome c family protein
MLARTFILISAAWAAAFAATPNAAIAPVPKRFASIAPIFKNHCIACHAGKNASGGIRLDSYEGLMKGGEHGKVIVKNKPESSKLIKLVKGSAKPIMPPSPPRLTSAEIKAISDWIKAGAKK